MLAGGGMKTGQVIGATDKHADGVKQRPVPFPEVFATMYHNLGLDLNRTTVRALNGRPHYLSETREPVRELI